MSALGGEGELPRERELARTACQGAAGTQPWNTGPDFPGHRMPVFQARFPAVPPVGYGCRILAPRE